MILAIDFDHTIMDNNNIKPGFRMGEPMPGAKEALQYFEAHNWGIIVFTARDRFGPVMDWLDHFEIPYSRVTNIKPPEAEVFIDDKAIRFTNWEQVMEYL